MDNDKPPGRMENQPGGFYIGADYRENIINLIFAAGIDKNRNPGAGSYLYFSIMPRLSTILIFIRANIAQIANCILKKIKKCIFYK